MPEPSKYGKALSALKQASSPSAKNVTPAVDAPVPPQPEPTAKAGRGGKRSDPEYAPTTFFVRKDTKRKAARLLEDMNAEQDLSDLVEQLLAKWVAEHSQV
jgi:hypothetical protein